MVPSGEILYSARTAYPDVLCRGRDNAVSMPLYRDGALVAPTQSGSTFSLYSPTSSTAIVDAAAVTVTGSIATYTITAATLPSTLTLGEGWREVWSLVVGGVARSYERTAALARISLSPSVTDADLLALYPSWSRARGAAVASFQPWIDEAWKRLMQRLLREGHLSYLIRTPDALREAHLHLSIALVARGVKPSGGAGSGESTWLTDAVYHEGQYEASWSAANWQVDYDNDGKVDDPTQRSRAGVAVHSFGVPGGNRRRLGWA